MGLFDNGISDFVPKSRLRCGAFLAGAFFFLFFVSSFVKKVIFWKNMFFCEMMTIFPKHCLQYGVLTCTLKEYEMHGRPQSYQIKAQSYQSIAIYSDPAPWVHV